MTNVTTAHPSHLATTDAQNTNEIAQGGGGVRRTSENIKNAAKALSQNKAFLNKAARSTLAMGAPTGDPVSAEEKSVGASAVRSKAAVEKDKKKSGTTNEVRKQVNSSSLVEKEDALTLINQALCLPEYNGLADAMMNVAYEAALENDKSKTAIVDNLSFGLKSKKITFVLSLMAALGDENLTGSSNADERAKVQKKLSSLYDPSGSDPKKISDADIQAFRQENDLKYEIGQLQRGMSLRHIGNFFRSVDDKSEGGQKTIFSIIDAAVKANPKNPLGALKKMYDSASSLLGTESQPSNSSANSARLANLGSDIRLIGQAISILESFGKNYNSCIACIDKMPNFGKNKAGVKATIPTEKFVIIFLEAFTTNSPVAIRKVKTELSNIHPSIRDLYLHHLSELMRLAPLIDMRFNDNVYSQISKLIKSLQATSYEEGKGNKS